MARKKEYTTQTEIAEQEFSEKLDSLDTQKERREVLETAAELIPDKSAQSGAATVNGVKITELEKQKPIEAKKNVYREAETGEKTEGVA